MRRMKRCTWPCPAGWYCSPLSWFVFPSLLWTPLKGSTVIVVVIVTATSAAPLPQAAEEAAVPPWTDHEGVHPEGHYGAEEH